MTAWTSDELSRIEHADELRVAPEGDDGALRQETPVWVVRDGDDLYIRSYRGRRGVWFRNASAHHEGRIAAGGVTKDVTFDESRDAALAARLDAAYRTKYGHYTAEYVDAMVAEDARAATLKLLPR